MSALLVLIGSISIGRPAWGVVLTIAFGIGMAAVLVGIGFGLVYARRLVERIPRLARSTLVDGVPILSAVVVLLAGFLDCRSGPDRPRHLAALGAGVVRVEANSSVRLTPARLRNEVGALRRLVLQPSDVGVLAVTARPAAPVR